MWEKEKFLVMNNISFFHNVCKRCVQQTRKNQGLFGKGLNAVITYVCLDCNWVPQLFKFLTLGPMVILSSILRRGNRQWLKSSSIYTHFNPLPDMPILSFLNSAAKKDMMSKIWTNWVTII